MFLEYMQVYLIYLILHHKSMNLNLDYLSLHSGNLRGFSQDNRSGGCCWLGWWSPGASYLSVNGRSLFEAHCLSASQTLSDYWTSTPGPNSWLPTSGMKIWLHPPPPFGTLCRQPKPSLFGFSVGRNSGSRKALDAALIVLALLSGQIKA